MGKKSAAGCAGAAVVLWSIGILLIFGASSNCTDPAHSHSGHCASATSTCQRGYDEAYVACNLPIQIDCNGPMPESQVVTECQKNLAGLGLTGAAAQCIIGNCGNCPAIDTCLGDKCGAYALDDDTDL
jgi:hypothetical protein